MAYIVEAVYSPDTFGTTVVATDDVEELKYPETYDEGVTAVGFGVGWAWIKHEHAEETLDAEAWVER